MAHPYNKWEEKQKDLEKIRFMSDPGTHFSFFFFLNYDNLWRARFLGGDCHGWLNTDSRDTDKQAGGRKKNILSGDEKIYARDNRLPRDPWKSCPESFFPLSSFSTRTNVHEERIHVSI